MGRVKKIDEELLSAYLDGEVAPEERSAVEDALKRDAALAESLEALRATKETVAALPRLRAPRSFAVQAPEPRRRWLPLVWRWATAAVVVMLVVVVGWGLMSGRQAAMPQKAAQAPARATVLIARAPARPTKAPEVRSLAVPEKSKAPKATLSPTPTPVPTLTPTLPSAGRSGVHGSVWYIAAALAVVLGVLLALKPGRQ